MPYTEIPQLTSKAHNQNPHNGTQGKSPGPHVPSRVRRGSTRRRSRLLPYRLVNYRREHRAQHVGAGQPLCTKASNTGWSESIHMIQSATKHLIHTLSHPRASVARPSWLYARPLASKFLPWSTVQLTATSCCRGRGHAPRPTDPCAITLLLIRWVHRSATHIKRRRIFRCLDGHGEGLSLTTSLVDLLHAFFAPPPLPSHTPRTPTPAIPTNCLR